MRILVIHNGYQHRGGEDAVVDAEVDLLRRYGHDVVVYRRDNHDIDRMRALPLLRDTVWSGHSYRDIATLVKCFSPDIAHAHNIFPLVSPSAYWALGAARVPVVQTLHNFRALCLQATFLRDNTVCEDCLGHVPWRGVARRCYRDSVSASAAVAATVTIHRMLGSYRHKVSRYIALSDFARRKFVDGGLPAERIVIKPNFVDVPPMAQRPRRGGLYVGRLSHEKGATALLEALSLNPTVTIDVIGTGPLEPDVSRHPQIAARGWQDPERVYDYMSRMAYLLLPSICYENFPRALVEAFACGLPVIAARFGAMPELIEHGRTGLLYEPGSATDLAEKIAWAETHPHEMEQMGAQARKDYDARFTPEKNYWQLMTIYGDAIGQFTPKEVRPAEERVHG